MKTCSLGAYCFESVLKAKFSFPLMEEAMLQVEKTKGVWTAADPDLMDKRFVSDDGWEQEGEPISGYRQNPDGKPLTSILEKWQQHSNCGRFVLWVDNTLLPCRYGYE